MEIKEYVPIIVALIAGLLGQPIVQLISNYSRRKFKKIKNADESFRLFEKFDTDFNENFILPDLKETYFYVQTGIKTNENSIEKYIELKNYLGGNYTWNHIKTAKPHLRIEKQGITVKLGKFERIFSNVVLIFSLLIFILGMIGFTYINYFENKSLKDIFIAIFVLIAPMFAGYSLVSGINSIIIAKAIEKRLKVLNENCA